MGEGPPSNINHAKWLALHVSYSVASASCEKICGTGLSKSATRGFSEGRKSGRALFQSAMYTTDFLHVISCKVRRSTDSRML